MKLSISRHYTNPKKMDSKLFTKYSNPRFYTLARRQGSSCKHI